MLLNTELSLQACIPLLIMIMLENNGDIVNIWFLFVYDFFFYKLMDISYNSLIKFVSWQKKKDDGMLLSKS